MKVSTMKSPKKKPMSMKAKTMPTKGSKTSKTMPMGKKGPTMSEKMKGKRDQVLK